MLRSVIVLVIVSVALSQLSFAGVSITNDTIICCAPWDATIRVTDPAGMPLARIAIHLSVVDKDGLNRVTPTLQTDRDGKARIHYKPSPGEALNIVIEESWMKYNLLIPVKNQESFAVYPVLAVVGSIVGLGLIFFLIKKARSSSFFSSLKRLPKPAHLKNKQQPGLGSKQVTLGQNAGKGKQSKWVFATKSTVTKKQIGGVSPFARKR